MKLNPIEDVEVDVEDLGREFRRMGPLIYRYSKLEAELQLDYDDAELDLKELRSQLYLNLKRDNPEMKETERKAAIDQHQDVKDLSRSLLVIKRKLRKNRGVLDALKAKKDMLVQLGADARKE